MNTKPRVRDTMGTSVVAPCGPSRRCHERKYRVAEQGVCATASAYSANLAGFILARSRGPERFEQRLGLIIARSSAFIHTSFVVV